LTAYYEDATRGDTALTALINSEEGFDIALEQTVENLREQNSELAEDEILTKSFVV
jgi:hypothetical protein